MGVAKCTASLIPSMEFPDITKAKREPACGARKTAPVWGEEKAHSPVNRKKKQLQQMFHCFCLFFVLLVCMCLRVCLGSFSIKDFLSIFPFLTSINNNAQMVYLGSFQMGVVKPKPRKSLQPITKDTNNTMNQSRLKANTSLKAGCHVCPGCTSG